MDSYVNSINSNDSLEDQRTNTSTTSTTYRENENTVSMSELFEEEYQHANFKLNQLFTIYPDIKIDALNCISHNKPQNKSARVNPKDNSYYFIISKPFPEDNNNNNNDNNNLKMKQIWIWHKHEDECEVLRIAIGGMLLFIRNPNDIRFESCLEVFNDIIELFVRYKKQVYGKEAGNLMKIIEKWNIAIEIYKKTLNILQTEI